MLDETRAGVGVPAKLYESPVVGQIHYDGESLGALESLKITDPIKNWLTLKLEGEILARREAKSLVPFDSKVAREKNRSYRNNLIRTFVVTEQPPDADTTAKVKPLSQIARLYVEGAIKTGKQTLATGIDVKKPKIDLMGIGIIEELQSVFDINRGLNYLRDEDLAKYFNSVAPSIEAIEVVAARSLFTIWRKHPPIAGTRRFDVSKIPADSASDDEILTAFTELYRNSDDFATYEFGKYIGSQLAKLYKPDSAKKTPNETIADAEMMSSRIQQLTRVTTSSIKEATIFDHNIKIALKKQTTEYHMAGSNRPLAKDKFTHDTHEDALLRSQMTRLDGADALTPTSNFARLFVRKGNLVTAGILSELRDELGLSEEQLSQFSEARAQELVSQLKPALTSLKTRAANALFSNWHEYGLPYGVHPIEVPSPSANPAEVLRAFEKIYENNPRFAAFQMGQLIGTEVHQIMTGHLFKPMSYDLRLSWDRLFEAYSGKEIGDMITTELERKKMLAPSAEPTSLTANAVEQFLSGQKAAPKFDSFNFWVADHWQELFGEKNDTLLGIVSELRDELGLSESYLPRRKFSAEGLTKVRDQVAKMMPVIDRIKKYNYIFGVEYSPTIPVTEVEFGKQIGVVFKEIFHNTFEQEQQNKKRAFIEVLKPPAIVEERGRVAYALSKVSRLNHQVVAAAQKLSSPEGARLFKSRRNVRQNLADIGAAAGVAKAYQLVATVMESSLERGSQMVGLGSAYLLRRLDINPFNPTGYKKIPQKLKDELNWRMLGKSAVRGVASASLIALTDQALRHIGLDSNLSVVELPLALTAAKLVTSGLLNSVGLNIGSEWGINQLFHHKQMVDDLGEYLHLRNTDPKQAEVYLQQKSKHFGKKNIRPKWASVQTFMDNELFSIAEYQKAATVLRRAERTLMLLMAHNPTAYQTRLTTINSKEVTIDNRQNLEKVLELESALHKKVRQIFPLTDAKKVIDILENDPQSDTKKQLSRDVAKHRLVNALAGTAINAALVVGSNLPLVRQLGQELLESLFGKASKLGVRPSVYTPLSTNANVKMMFEFNPENFSDFKDEMVSRTDTLVYLLNQTDKYGPIADGQLKNYGITHDNLQEILAELKKGNLTPGELGFLLKLTTTTPSTDQFAQSIQHSLSGTPRGSLAPIIEFVHSNRETLTKAIGTSLNAQGLADNVGVQNYELLAKLGIHSQDLDYQMQFLSRKTQEAVRNNKSLFFSETDSVSRNRIFILKGREALAASFTASADESPRPLFILKQLENVVNGPPESFQNAINNPLYKYFLAESANNYGVIDAKESLYKNSPIIGQLKSLAALSDRFGAGLEKDKTINLLVDKAMRGDTAAFVTLYNGLQQSFPGEMYWYSKSVVENEPLNRSLIVNIFTSKDEAISNPVDLVENARRYSSNLFLSPLSETKKIDPAILGEFVLTEKNVREMVQNFGPDTPTSPQEVMTALLSGTSKPDQILEKLLGLPPIIFTSGGRFSTYFHISREDYPKGIFDLANQIEGPTHPNIMEFYFTLAKRGYGYFRGTGELAGGSDPGMQLVELIGGGPPNQLMLDPLRRAFLFQADDDPHARFIQLTKTVAATFKGEQPKQLQEILNNPEFSNNIPSDILAKINWKLESFLLSQQLRSTYGDAGVEKLWLNYIPMGSVEGQAIFGIEAAAMTYFGKSVDDLNTGEQLFLVGLINNPGRNSPLDPEGIIRVVSHLENDTIPNILLARKVIQPQDVAKITKELHELKFTNKIPDAYKVVEPTGFDSNKALANIVAQENPIGKTRTISHRPMPMTYVNGIGLIVDDGNPNPDAASRIAALVDKKNIIRPQLPDSVRHFFDTIFNQAAPENPYNYSYTANHYLGENSPLLKIKFPEFEIFGSTPETTVKVPGFTMLALGENDKVEAFYDQTGLFYNPESGSGVPIPIGSTIKPFLFAFLSSEGVNTDEMLPDQPGQWALNHVQVPGGMGNAYDALNDSSPENKLSLKQALAFSANVPFEGALRQYLDDHPKDGWIKYQNFLRKFGLEFTDQQGNEITAPTQAAAIASDVYTKGGLTRLAHAYQMLANPENPNYGFSKETDQKIIQAVNLATQTLKDPQYKTTPSPNGFRFNNFETSLYTIPDGFVKTGTVGGAFGTSHLLSVMVVPNGHGGNTVLVGMVTGQTVANNIPQAVDLGRAFGSTTVLPILREYYEDLVKPKESSP